MTSPLSSFSGLISGFNYRDLVDEIIRLEGRPAQRLRAQVTSMSNQLAALGTYRGLLDGLRGAAKSFRDGTAFDSTTATTTVVSGQRALATVSTSAGAIPASYSLEVSQLAQAQKLGGAGVADAATPAGLSGTFILNGVTVTVDAADSLIDIRDAINAANTGATPSKVSASILTVSDGDHRLILTSDATGSAGIALSDSTGAVLQSLGFLDAMGALAAGAELVDGRDAQFSLDGVDFVRSGNVVSDAIANVTLTLTGDEAGAKTLIQVDRYLDGGRTAAQKFVDGYNALVTFLKEQGTATETSRPALYGDSLLRSARSGLPTRLLLTVFGAAEGLATASAAGFSFTRDGTLALDATKFDAAFRDRYQDLRTLFMETRTATSADVTFLTSGGNAAGGTYAIDITAPATRAEITSSGFAGTYDAGATADELRVNDNRTGKSVTVALTTGMTTADIVTALNDAFASDGVEITAEAVGSEVRLTHDVWGSLAGITVTTTGTGDGAAELWAAPATVYGTDVQGTIGGNAATGSGQQLVGDEGTVVAGLTVSYTGTVAGPTGSVGLTVGAGALVERLLDSFLAVNTGTLSLRETSIKDRSASLEARAATLEARLEEKRAVLLRKFIRMESAVARLQQQSQSLLGLSKLPDSSR